MTVSLRTRPAEPPCPPVAGGVRDWLPVVAATSVPLFVPVAWPAWTVMWATAVSIYTACKWLTWNRSGAAGVPPVRSVAYFMLWPGLDARRFLVDRLAGRPGPGEWAFAAAKLAFGIGITAFAARRESGLPEYVRGWCGMTGLVFVLHFGAFHLLSCFWRRRGIDARPIMDWPAAAASLSDFWGRRWNTAFRDLAHRFLFRPLTTRLGPPGGLLAGFLFSGLVHDAVISLPARGGYGGPTAYFLIQAAGLLAERSRPGRQLGLATGPLGRLFTAAVVLLPAPLLFHPPFVTRVVVPFLDQLGGWA